MMNKEWTLARQLLTDTWGPLLGDRLNQYFETFVTMLYFGLDALIFLLFSVPVPITRSFLFIGSSIPYSTAWGSYTGSPAFTPAALFGNGYLTHSSLDTYSQLSPGGVGSSSVTPLPYQTSLTQVRLQIGTLIVFDLVITMTRLYTGCR